MAKIEILMPNMGESIYECTVLKWLVKEGDAVEVDDMIIEVATDKVDTEIGSSHTGVISRFLVQEGDIAKIGSPICELETEEQVINSDAASDLVTKEHENIKLLESDVQKAVESVASLSSSESRFYSPLVLNIAKEENISQTDLDGIVGTGQNGRVTKDDILDYLKVKNKVLAPKVENIVSAQVSSDTINQIVEMDRMRKMIAQRMVESKRISPHVTSFIETDMTKIVNWRNEVKDSFKKLYKENLTFTPLLIQAVTEAIKKYPGINVQVDGDNIVYKKDINIGMAVALPSGNLIVPVIHRADQLTLSQLSARVNDLANRARNNQLKPDELMGGTFTISNIGNFGNIAGTPIIVQPQVAIMAFGVIRKMPAVIETPEGDLIGIRQKMVISHAYDHRVVDGSLGGLFLKEVSDNLEKFNQKEI